MTVRVGQLFRKKTVKSLDGRIIDLVDEADGGLIVHKGMVVNQAKWDEIQKKEEDKRKAAQAINHQKVAPQEETVERNSQPTRIDAIEKKVGQMEGKLDAILEALNKK